MLVVVIVLALVLAGGLAAVAITSGELSGTQGYRTRITTEACAQLAIERIRALIATGNLGIDFAATAGTTTIGSTTLSFRGGHYNNDGATPVTVLDPGSYDVTSNYEGENATNSMGGGAISRKVLSTTAICSGPGYGTREVQVVFRYGVGAR